MKYVTYGVWVLLLLLSLHGQAAELTSSQLTGAATKLEILNQMDQQRANRLAVPPVLPATGQQLPVQPNLPKQETQQTKLHDFDYSTNLNSEVFGANMFSGAFSEQGAVRFNPEYLVQQGDSIIVRLWGAFNFDSALEVDAQGNIFIPNVGPVKVSGVRNQSLQAVVETAVRTVYRKNVFTYASMNTAQPVRIYVGGFVNRPGMYPGTSFESLLNFLDRAGGIDPERGSFLNVAVKRDGKIRAVVNLYNFLLNGVIPNIQLADGDVIFVSPRHHTALVSGLVANAKRFEFADNKVTIKQLVALARPQAAATHVRVTRNTGSVKNTEYYALSDIATVQLNNGDELEFTADKKPGTITVRVEGEHESLQEYVLPYGAKLGELMQNIKYYPSADSNNIQLFRKSVQERQKQMLATALKSLESSVLTARSATNEESRLRRDEAELMLQWIEKAKQIEPIGQVIVAQSSERNNLLLENGDIIKVPKNDGLVLVSGEVLFPNAVAYQAGSTYEDYIKRAGGYTQSADTSRIVVAHRDGSYENTSAGGWRNLVGGSSSAVTQGDEILVLPKVQTKSIEVTRGLTQILYQMAIAARVIIDLN